MISSMENWIYGDFTQRNLKARGSIEIKKTSGCIKYVRQFEGESLPLPRFPAQVGHVLRSGKLHLYVMFIVQSIRLIQIYSHFSWIKFTESRISGRSAVFVMHCGGRRSVKSSAQYAMLHCSRTLCLDIPWISTQWAKRGLQPQKRPALFCGIIINT